MPARRNTTRHTDPGPLAASSGRLVESHAGHDWHILVFYPAIAALLLLITAGFAYQQLIKTDEYADREKLQSHRRIIFPAPRGDIHDREGRLLVGNKPRYALTINLDALKSEFRLQYLQVRKNYRDAYDKDIPSNSELWKIARGAVVQRYLDQVNAIIGRDEHIDGDNARARDFERHFNQQLLLPYTLLNDLTAAEYSRLAEQLPVTSPLQLTATSVRIYPFDNAAAHTLGYIQNDDSLSIDDFPGDELTTFRMLGTIGKNGLEAAFNDHLQGKAGAAIYRVDPAGYRIEPPIERRSPIQGKNLATSLDIDLQLACENAMGPSGSPDAYTGAVVALDVQTGEVLVMCSRPDYNLNDFSPRISQDTFNKITAQGAWYPRALSGLYPPGSTFKLVTGIAAMRAGKLDAATTYNCAGRYLVGNRLYDCHDRHAHGDIVYHEALSKSCNIYFYQVGLSIGAQPMADQARAFGLDKPTGIELPHETKNMLVPDPAWKRRVRGDGWSSGDTVTMAIGQSDLLVTPLGMACMAASIARNELRTPPTLLHDDHRAPLHTEPTGLTPAQRAMLIEAMRETVKTGTAKSLLRPPLNLGALDIAGKTGTAQKQSPQGMMNFAWFVGFAPASNPRIAIAVLLEGDVAGEEFGGGAKAAPVAGWIFKKYFEKHPGHLPPLAQ